MKKASTILAVFIFLTGSHLQCAQIDESPVSVTLRFFSINRQPIRNLYYLNPNDEYEEIQFRSRLRSDPYPYLGPERISFYHKIQLPEVEDPVFEEVTFVTPDIPTGELLIFFLQPGVSGNREEDKWVTLAMDDSERAFPLGNFLILNATGVSLDGVVGSQALRLDFGFSESFPSLSRGRTSHIEVAFALKVENGHELVYSNQLVFSAEGRSILVLRPPRRSRSIQIDTFLLEDSPIIADNEVPGDP